MSRPFKFRVWNGTYMEPVEWDNPLTRWFESQIVDLIDNTRL